MPCNKLAVRAAALQIDARLLRALFANPLALRAMADALVQASQEQVSVWNDQNATWVDGYLAYRSRQANHQTVPLAQVARADAAYIDFCTAHGTIRLAADSSLEARDGWEPGRTRRDMAQLLATFGQAVTLTAVVVAQNLVVEALRQAGVTVERDEVNPQASARIITLTL